MIKIIHLSDMHISSSEDPNHIRLREKLINSVKKFGTDADVVVFTGDLVDRYDVKAFDKGKEFLEKLMQKLELSMDRLIIVPGNHDMMRGTQIESIIGDGRFKNDEECEGNWRFLRTRMDEYTNFIKALNITENQDNFYGYGIKLVEINGQKFIFNMLNSAWTNQGAQDYGNLFIGRWQLENNCRAIKEKKSENDLVITLMHHPLVWLKNEEQEMLRDYMLSENKFDSPILLHGHIHKAGITAEENPRGKIISLISGIGYAKSKEREAGQHKVAECKYAIYNIDEESGTTDCFCLESTDTAEFVPDLKLYGGSTDGHYSISWKKLYAKNEESVSQMDLDPVPVTSCWSGRKEELELINKNNINVIAISGVGGQGKTALAAEFYRRDIETGAKYEKHIWVDCRELQNTMHAKLLQLLEAITGGKESVIKFQDEQLRDTIQRFYQHAKKEKLLVVFDNVDAYVNLESEELTNELRDLVDIILTQQNNSLIILTCRMPIYDSNANFRTIKLDGLNELDGIDYFQMRGIKVEDDDNKNACKKIIRITKGHPWWIGLIAGQILAERTCPKEYLEDNSEGILAKGSQVKQYFSSIWDNLSNNNKGEHAQQIVRYLAESARPLSLDDISSLLRVNYNQANKAVKLLKGISLLIEHDNKNETSKKFQIHPLVREFVHEIYSAEEQRSYVHLLLVLIIGNRVYEHVFINKEQHKSERILQCDTQAFTDAIETCLNARNSSEALTLMSYAFSTLCDGCHAQFLQLGERILNEVDWKKEEVTLIKDRAAFLCEYIDILAVQEHKREKVLSLIKKYEQFCEKNTLPYSGFLFTRAEVMWRLGDYEEAHASISEYERIKEKNSDVWFKQSSINLHGMILRDIGKIDEALEVLETDIESSNKYGNIARCYMLKKDFTSAIEKMKLCISELNRINSFESWINRGYAYFWIAEIYEELGDLEKAKIFVTMCLEIWKEYAPMLMSLTNELLNKLHSIDVNMAPGQANDMVREFMEINHN